MPEAVASPDAPPSGPLPPTPEQEAALTAVDEVCFIEAGAGSGKTRVLAERFCDAISAPEAGIESALAFTFTEKAAGELRTRVRRELDRRASDAEGEEAVRLRALAKRMGSAWVTTIHGFCRRLLSSHPAAAGVDPRFTVLDEPAAQRLAARAFELALEEWLAGGDRDRIALAASRGADTLSALIRTTYERMRTIGVEEPALPPIGPPSLQESLAQLEGTAAAALAETETANTKKGPALREAMARAGEIAARGGAPSALFGELSRCIFKQESKAFGGPAVSAHLEALKVAIGRAAEPRYAALDELLRDFGERYTALKEERSALDFEDLQLRAIRLLRERPQIAATYRDAFGEILVDEFQDTNRIQVTLIELLRGPGTRLVTVGDELQSIYGFRNADIEVFRLQRELGTRLPLKGNFRSSPEVLALVNALGAALIKDFHPLTSGTLTDPGAPAGAELLLTPKAGWAEHEEALAGQPDIGAPPERVAEARAIASRLVELHDEGRGPALGEMVVLLRAYTHVATYEEALERAGLEPYVVGGSGYWSHQQVDDMRCLLGVVSNPLDDERLFGALASPAGGVSPDALWLLRRAAGRGRRIWPVLAGFFGDGPPLGYDDEEEAEKARDRIEAIAPADAERLRTFCARLGELRADAAQMPLEALVERTASAFDYDLAVLSMHGGRRRWANVRKLMRLAREHEAREGRELRGFLAAIDERALAEDREAEAAIAPEDHDGVRVMTIHNAKGLEFGVVVVADLNRPLVTGGFAPAVRVAPGAGPQDPPRVGLRLGRVGEPAIALYELDALSREAAAEEAAEACRLVYVAATRAQRHLILSGIVDPGALAKPNDDPPAPSHQPIAWILRGLGVDAIDGRLVLEPAGDEDPPVPLGAGATLTLPAPALRVGLEGRPAAPQVALRVVEPSRERAVAMSAVRAPRTGERPGSEAPPERPLLDGAEGDGHVPPATLTYGALKDYEACGYRYYAERVLGLARLDPGPRRAPEDEPAPDGEAQLSLLEPPAEEPRTGGVEFGEAMHSLLEWSAHHGLERPSEEVIAATLAAGGGSAERAARMLDEWMHSELRSRLLEPGTRLIPEAPFTIDLAGSIVRGRADLLALREGEPPLIVDFKTDRLAGREPAAVAAAAYGLQRDLYALAVAGGGAVETAWIFLEQPGAPVMRSYASDELTGVRDRLTGLVESTAAGRFEVTDRPHWGLCGTCPARPALCSHPPELTTRRHPG